VLGNKDTNLSFLHYYLNLSESIKHVFGSEGTVAGMGCQTLACALEVMLQSHLALNLTARRYNFVSVTRRSIRVESWSPRQRGHKAVTVRGEYGAVFAVQVQSLWPIRVSRYKVDREQVTSQGAQSFIADTGAVAV